MKAIISIHDVMPETLQPVAGLLESLPEQCRPGLTLLIVPGRQWAPAQIDQLRDWQRQGCLLAGHGWLHEARRRKSVYHHLHALLLSRNAAEHLSQTSDELQALVAGNHAWFARNDLETPDCYVPPAWAMGKLSNAQLRALPFRYYETTSGIYDSERDVFTVLPLAGFEADTAWRQYSLGFWNGINRRVAGDSRPLRIAIHPHDDKLRLQAALRSMLQAVSSVTSYRLT